MNNEGWGLPALARKWHYFRNARSLCGLWGFMGRVIMGGDTSPDNCVSCQRKLKRLGTISTLS